MNGSFVMTDLGAMHEKVVSNPSLLAVDAGLRCGLALFDLASGQLRWFRSHNFGSAPRLRRAAASLIKETPDVVACVIEGGGMIADPWIKAAAFHRIDYCQSPPNTGGPVCYYRDNVGAVRMPKRLHL